MADCIVLNCTNMELLAANPRKKQRVQYIYTQYNGQKAYIFSLEDMKKRR